MKPDHEIKNNVVFLTKNITFIMNATRCVDTNTFNHCKVK